MARAGGVGGQVGGLHQALFGHAQSLATGPFYLANKPTDSHNLAVLADGICPGVRGYDVAPTCAA